MKVAHDPVVAERFPGHATGVIRARAPSLLPDRGAVESLRQRLSASGADHARMAAKRWREVFAKMGAKPKHRSSIDALAGRFDEVGPSGVGPGLPPLVEFYNLLSLVLAVPMGGYRTDRIVGDLRLTVPGKGKPFTPLGRPREEERTRGGEVAYLDDEKVVCRYWNLVDSDQTKLGQDHADVLFVFDFISDLLPISPESFLAETEAVINGALPAATTSSGVADGARVDVVVV
jgi:DNA/RNA-binding domain of Phe-tRNA-synthetase-like protein